MKIHLFTFLLLAAMAGCSNEDKEKTRRQLEDAKRELQKDAHQAGRELKKDAHEASREINKGVDEIKREVKPKDSDRDRR